MANVIWKVIRSIAIFSSLAAPQNTSVNVFMPTAFDNSIGFAASIIGVCQETTTYGIRCTSGTLASGVVCGPDFPESTITEDATAYVATQTTPISAAVVAFTETCSLKGTTEASCTATVSIAGTKTTRVTSTSSVLSGSWIPEFYMYQIPVTAGVQHLHVTGNACSAASRHGLPVLEGAIVGITLVVLLAIL